MADFLELSSGKFIFKVATDRLYTREGAWVLFNGDSARIGVTDFFQQRNGDLAFVTLPPVGTVLAVGDEMATIETIKVSLSLSAPFSGRLTKANGELAAHPETVNLDPYGDGWLLEISTGSDPDRTGLLDPPAYLELMQTQISASL